MEAPRTRRRTRLRNSIRKHLTRDTLIFVSGLTGIIYETTHGAERPTLLILFAGMIGLPAFLHHDEVRHGDTKAVELSQPEQQPPGGGETT